MSGAAVIPRRANLTERVIAAFFERIDSGIYAPGEKLPSETELCLEFGVSRTVVREAVASLRLGGRLQSRQGVGVFVADKEARRLDFDIQAGNDVRSALEILELRLGVELEAVGLAAQRRTPNDIAALSAAFDKLAARQTADPRQEAEADWAFHLALARATGNAHFPQFMEALEGHIASDLLMKYGRTSPSSRRTYTARIVKEHGAILAAVIQGDGKTARLALRQHLEESMTRYRRLLGSASSSTARMESATGSDGPLA